MVTIKKKQKTKEGKPRSKLLMPNSKRDAFRPNHCSSHDSRNAKHYIIQQVGLGDMQNALAQGCFQAPSGEVSKSGVLRTRATAKTCCKVERGHKNLLQSGNWSRNASARAVCYRFASGLPGGKNAYTQQFMLNDDCRKLVPSSNKLRCRPEGRAKHGESWIMRCGRLRLLTSDQLLTSDWVLEAFGSKAANPQAA